MTKELALSTVSCHLAIVTTKKDDNKMQFFVTSLLPLTTLFFLLWQFGQAILSFQQQAITATGDICRVIDTLLLSLGTWLDISIIIGKSVLWSVLS